MCGRLRIHPAACLALAMFLFAPAPAPAAEPGADAGVTTRFTLTSSSSEVAPQQSGRYSLRGRFAAVESAGELREGDNFTLIGRFAKGNVSCGVGGVIFSNGFEGN